MTLCVRYIIIILFPSNQRTNPPLKKYSPYLLVAAGILVFVLGISGSFSTLYDSILQQLGLVNDLGDPLMGFKPLDVPLTSVIGQQTAPDVEITLPPANRPQIAFATPTKTSLIPFPTQASVEPTQIIPTPTLFPTIPTQLEIPIIDLVAPIVPSDPAEVKIGGDIFEQWKAPDKFAVGWHTRSALLGQVGNTVFNGHHNVFEKVFENLNKVVPGDEIIVFGGRIRYTYIVVNVMILPERNVDLATRLENARWILPSNDERLTLITCWPAESNTHRLIVVAQPVGNPIEIIPTVQPESADGTETGAATAAPAP